MQNLTIAGLQAELAWHDWESNKETFSKLLEDVNSGTDIVLLPEMFGSGFTMHPEAVAQMMNGPGVSWMLEQAKAINTTLIGSLVISDEGKYHNRLIAAYPDGSLSHYDKRHLFSYAGEHEKYTSGSHKLLITVNNWRICPLICYDLRFPVWSRNDLDYDVLLYIANWPEPRIDAWRALLKARAIENLAYTVGLNRVGRDEPGNNYPGNSAAYDFGGNQMYLSGETGDVFHLEFDKVALNSFRDRYNFLADRDSYIIR